MDRNRKITAKFLLLLITMTLTVNFLVACKAKEKGEEKETTKKETESITEKLAEKETTEAETKFDPTKYEYKGVMFCVDSEERFDFFKNFKLSPGDILSINEICEQMGESDDGNRGWLALVFYEIMGQSAEEILTKEGYDTGNGVYHIPYEDNYTIEYSGTDTYEFEYIGMIQGGMWYFDVYKK